MFVENTSVSSGGPFTHARSETLAFEAMLFKAKLCKTKNYTRQLLKNLKDEKYTHFV